VTQKHIKGPWEVIRAGNITIAQGYKCSCGVIGCSLQRPSLRHRLIDYINYDATMMFILYRRRNTYPYLVAALFEQRRERVAQGMFT
jgi:hypothetical protein